MFYIMYESSQGDRRMVTGSDVYPTEDGARNILLGILHGLSYGYKGHLTYKEGSFYAFNRREVGAVVPLHPDANKSLLKKGAELKVADERNRWDPILNCHSVRPVGCYTCALLRDVEVCGAPFKVCTRRNGPVFSEDEKDKTFFTSCERHTR